jgi:NAD(P)-dependent dehydrogenase (short-subunit alcohol dehydrogenase family)
MTTSVFYSPATSNAFIPLALIYTCVAHLWLYSTKGLSSLLLSTWRNKKNHNTNQAVVGITGVLQQYASWPPSLHSADAADDDDLSHNPNDFVINDHKVAIITGSNTGIGFQTAKTLVVDYGYHVILACRSKDKALQAQQTINNCSSSNSSIRSSSNTSKDGRDTSRRGQAIVLESILDLSDFDSIRQFAKEVNEKYNSIDLLINNAGRNTSGKLTWKPNHHSSNDQNEKKAKDYEDAFDLMFVSNYLGHFVLTQLLLDKLKKKNAVQSGNGHDSISGVIVNVSSVMHHFSCLGDSSVSTKSPIAQRTTAMAPSLSTTETTVPFHIEEDDHDDAICRPQYQYWKSRAHYHHSSTPLPDVYSATKLAAILHAIELNRRYATTPLTSNEEKHDDGMVYAMAVNPGAVNSDIWRVFPNWMRVIFQKVYLTTQQGSVPLVAAAVMGDHWKQHGVLYLQPYWNPFNLVSFLWSPPTAAIRPPMTGPMLPFTEMLGPYIGYTPTTPRLPDKDGGTEAARILWRISEELASTYS